MLSPLSIGSKVFDWKEIPYFVGILNVTPDSFSDGGRYFNLKNAILRAKELLEEGADIIDVGGESTRPFSNSVSEEEELQRVIPVIKAIKEEFPSAIISVDTYKSKVAAEALKVGADIVNDISALRFDKNMLNVIKDYNCPVIIMHMQGTPKTMQINPVYDNVIEDIKKFFKNRIEFLVEQGISFEKIIIDPGIGFGKTFEHNIEILKNLESFYELNRPVLIGHSRKSFIGKIINKPPQQREGGTIGVSIFTYLKKVHFLRVHKVDFNKDAIKVFKILIN
ncbi:dihydropteroate synthase [Thermodesulfobacterium hydrogeniphilum]|uniref:dihydropteroate synthase n=1 Tax=Thermodesulfobacterium hydrogeniphilum TaxID=161156 RepID=UPI0005701504|nr:dihydropteroate synthase [Thermodesulfobacterium hydrogeniphilum]